MKKIGVLFVIIAAVMWATCGVFIKILTQCGFTENEITFAKVGISLILIFIFMKMVGEKIEKICSVKDIVFLFLSGSIGYLMYGLTYAKAVRYIPISAAVALVYTAPIIVMVFSVFLFHEQLTVKKIICFVLVVLGCFLVQEIKIGQSFSVKGIALGMTSGICYAIYTLANKYLLEKYSVYSISFYNFLFAFLVIFFLTDKTQIFYKVLHSDIKTLMYLLFFALFCGGLSHTLYVKALEYLEASKASIFTIIEPFTASILGIILFHEANSIAKTLGLAMILFSLILLNITIKCKKNCKNNTACL
ncbi:EamA family transporter [Clostridium sp. MD294]|uniref:DMT family transporter n=1 Tax=Clostridium sp. MD294 TaxID=97138 RepID=UPI0002CCC094|nr:EamA family transporter [Clostridium sp. MD294]NDO45936.1 EamA family transporter [Clostridium sp. MD294]USF30405.1 putative inner membrane transporter YicL [Clostridium sp. MD294]